ncbi:hypothetical protein [Jiella avicenniae]|uniref:Uncharacterized protein n=1 Tax=Jiella avicenniae TaxID=2907202 RepID=A0A9X1P2C5_9HYPH|nr:hypothetical protein [Jiella avicenniae]MCE7028011.1 hypothetical protein [Jiella avicenniae]
MVVYYMDSDLPAGAIPRQRQYRIIRDRLSESEISEVHAYLNELIGDSDIETSSWIPRKSDWSDTPLFPIYKKAARMNEELAAQFFGILVFKTFMERDDEWITGRFELDGAPLPGRTYFKKRY